LQDQEQNRSDLLRLETQARRWHTTAATTGTIAPEEGLLLRVVVVGGVGVGVAHAVRVRTICSSCVGAAVSYLFLDYRRVMQEKNHTALATGIQRVLDMGKRGDASTVLVRTDITTAGVSHIHDEI